MPYPGAFIDSSVAWRAFVTGMLAPWRDQSESVYFQTSLQAAREAGEYARENCQNYFEFQRRWPMMMERIWEDVALPCSSPASAASTGRRSPAASRTVGG